MNRTAQLSMRLLIDRAASESIDTVLRRWGQNAREKINATAATNSFHIHYCQVIFHPHTISDKCTFFINYECV